MQTRWEYGSPSQARNKKGIRTNTYIIHSYAWVCERESILDYPYKTCSSQLSHRYILGYRFYIPTYRFEEALLKGRRTEISLHCVQWESTQPNKVEFIWLNHWYDKHIRRECPKFLYTLFLCVHSHRFMSCTWMFSEIWIEYIYSHPFYYSRRKPCTRFVDTAIDNRRSAAVCRRK